MTEITWGIPLTIDLWLAGLAGGAYFSAFLMYRYGGERHKGILQRATLIGLPLAALGVFLLVLDLGEPLRAWHLFARFKPGSPMSMGSWILLLWLICGVVLVILWAQGLLQSLGTRFGILGQIAQWIKPFTPVADILIWPAFILAALLMIYTGVVLGTSNKALWSGSFFVPSLFVSSAVPTGIAAISLALLAKPVPQQEDVMSRLAKVLIVVLGLQLLVLVAHLIWLGFFSTTAASAGAQRLVSGSLWFPFWGGAVVVGILIPLGLEVWMAFRRGRFWSYIGAISALCLLAGGFFLRAVLLVGGQG